MFQILEIKQQIFPMERISSHASLLHRSQELSLKRARVTPSMLGVLQQNLNSSAYRLPCRFRAECMRLLLFLLVLWENRLGLWIHSHSDLLPAGSRGGTPACSVGTAAAWADGAFRNKAARSLQSRTCTWTNNINN